METLCYLISATTSLIYLTFAGKMLRRFLRQDKKHLVGEQLILPCSLLRFSSIIAISSTVNCGMYGVSSVIKTSSIYRHPCVQRVGICVCTLFCMHELNHFTFNKRDKLNLYNDDHTTIIVILMLMRKVATTVMSSNCMRAISFKKILQRDSVIFLLLQ